MAKVCPGFLGTATEHDAFVGSTSAQIGCVPQCIALVGFRGLVDPTHCASTVLAVKSVLNGFAYFCDNGAGG
jgi:hypothetical protein